MADDALIYIEGYKAFKINLLRSLDTFQEIIMQVKIL